MSFYTKNLLKNKLVFNKIQLLDLNLRLVYQKLNAKKYSFDLSAGF